MAEKKCCLCSEMKIFRGVVSKIVLRYENGLMVDLDVQGNNGFICEDCRSAMLNAIAGSKLLWIENLLEKANG